jgi:hypothetical protein
MNTKLIADQALDLHKLYSLKLTSAKAKAEQANTVKELVASIKTELEKND